MSNNGLYRRVEGESLTGLRGKKLRLEDSLRGRLIIGSAGHSHDAAILFISVTNYETSHKCTGSSLLQPHPLLCNFIFHITAHAQ